MANDEKTTRRVREALSGFDNVIEKRMFSGLTFMVNDKMCISVGPNRIMCRIDPAMHEEAVKKEGANTVVMKNKPLPGYVYVLIDNIATKKQLDYWIGLCLDFNKNAKSSKKKNPKRI